MSSGDKSIRCCDCGTNFTFTAAEQRFFESKDFSEPRRCAPCRRAKKQQSGSSGNNLYNYSRR